MSKDRLAIDDRGNHYRIGWFLAEDSDFGLMLGEEWGKNKRIKKRPATTGAAEVWAAEHAVAKMANATDNAAAFLFYSKSTAQDALRAANAALKALSDNRELEPWEKTALAHGWKPPKGWKGPAK